MRFIRKGGRVIPIKDSGDSADYKKQYAKSLGSTAKLTAVAVGVMHASHVATALHAKKLAAGLTVSGAALGLGNMVHQVDSSRAVAKASGGRESALGLFIGHQVVASGTGLVLGAASRAGFKGSVKAVIGAKEVLGKAALGAHAAIKPHSAAFREARKMASAVKVAGAKAADKALVPTTGIRKVSGSVFTKRGYKAG